ncbi:MAG: ABC transporter ATP-binding protein [Alphaproteobacteria bacterium]|nr:ABC transporter ATP-binding protein [Alphaproteobacteria bacterium]MBL6939203.1 ABC transporter ATP-binding protein [Alphaproteobacteria bacterium]MBL7096719.1 ABC transporter ATP-binding protein [Alphaproteobacteria bacterium]
MSDALRLENVSRIYKSGDGGQLEVFSNINLTLREGELVALVGQSGAGKSSLLHMAGLLEAPSSGEVYVMGAPASTLADAERTRIRRDTIGFVYQAHHLLPEFSALENVVMPMRIAGRPRGECERDARHILTHLGLGERLTHRPAQLSGGEQQRVAIARALANRPRILLADEPTGNLDTRTSGGVFDALVDLVRSEGLAALVATHNLELAAQMDRIVMLQDGQLVDAGKLAAHA